MKMDAVNSFTKLMPSYAQPGAGDGPGSASFSDALAQAVAQMEQAKAASAAGVEEEQEEPSLIERINDKGFVAFAEELQQEKIKELREQILKAMGYSQEDLEAMSPEQRAEIEKIVDNEIMKRMMANAALKEENQGQNQNVIVGLAHKAEIHASVVSVTMETMQFQSNFLQGKVGLGPLLVHQEVDAERAAYPQFKDPGQDLAQDSAQKQVGKKDREKLV